MGASFTLDREVTKARQRSEEIDKQLAELAKQDQNAVKILLLGAGESGKSTLVKQMKIIHGEGFTQEELITFRPTVMDNLFSSMKYVLTGMGLLRINLQSSSNKSHAKKILASSCCFDNRFNMLPEVFQALHALWNDRGVRLAIAHGNEYALNDSAIYLFENMDRICGKRYIPTATDVLRARVRTNGIIETHFKVNDTIIRMVDVGGQRSQRRKWISCFDDVKAVLFVSSLSCYDISTVVDEPSTNQLEESLNLFGQIVNSSFFHDSTLILFLNKFDLFRKKILYSGRHLRFYFTDYEGPDEDVDRAALFFQHKFGIRHRNPTKMIHTHFTTAIDTSNIQVVFQVVMDSISKENIQQVTLL